MTNELICYDCLTNDDKRVEAVTTVSGTAVCERCARERADLDREVAGQAEDRQQQIFDQLGSITSRKPLIGG